MKIQVRANSHSYDVVIGKGILRQSFESISSLMEKADQLIVLTDQNIWNAQGDYFSSQMPMPYDVFIMPNGEAGKTFANFEAVHTFLLEKNCTRKSFIIAFGGGAVGDLAGFVAATFMRGIPFIQVPTTILAHDSAVGGKTAINHPLGKNLIGAFYQPQIVIYDTNMLSTLPEVEIRSGMAEVVKHAMLSDEKWLHELLQLSYDKMTDEQLSTYLAKGIQVKASIVEQDETEQSVRMFLNLGHTYGHALEAAAGYGKLTHGECVMIGIIYMLLLCEEEETISPEFTNEFIQFLYRNSYPLDALDDYSFEQLKQYMIKDKKADYGELQFVLLQKMGVPFIKKVDLEMCERIDQLLRQRLTEVLR